MTGAVMNTFFLFLQFCAIFSSVSLFRISKVNVIVLPARRMPPSDRHTSSNIENLYEIVRFGGGEGGKERGRKGTTMRRDACLASAAANVSKVHIRVHGIYRVHHKDITEKQNEKEKIKMYKYRITHKNIFLRYAIRRIYNNFIIFNNGKRVIVMAGGIELLIPVRPGTPEFRDFRYFTKCLRRINITTSDLKK